MKLRVPGSLGASQLGRALRDFRIYTAPRYARKTMTKRPPRVANLDEFSSLWWHRVVFGYGLAEQQTDGRRTGRLALRFYVCRKFPKQGLKSKFRIPRIVRIRVGKGHSVEIPTDVVELRRIPAIQRTVHAGNSMGHFIGVNGTFGIAVVDSKGRRYALTCAHVAAPHWVEDVKDDAVESPSDPDQKAGANVMGTVEDWTVLDKNGINTVDAALVRPQSGVTLSNDHLSLPAQPRFSPLTAATFANMRSRAVIIQSQRGPVDGVIDSVLNDLPIDFNADRFRFADVVSYSAPVESGDSGSIVVDAATRDVLGLHFAGLSSDWIGYCVLASMILRAFQKYELKIA